MEIKLKVEGPTLHHSDPISQPEIMLTLEQLFELASDLLPDRDLTVYGNTNDLYINCFGDCTIRGNTLSEAVIEDEGRGWTLRLNIPYRCEVGMKAGTLKELRQQLSEFYQKDTLIGIEEALATLPL